MRTAIDVTLFWAALLAAISVTGSGFEMRGPVAEVVDGESYSWSAQEFAGFRYDLDDGAGGEHLSLSISDGAVEASGAVYATRAQEEPMEFSAWGSRWTIGFLGEARFAGYSSGHLSDESGGELLLRDERIGKVLIDDDEERTIEKDVPLKLEEGYRLAVGEVDPEGGKVSLELLKDGARVDSAVVELSSENGSSPGGTYLYKRPVGGEDVVFIAVHFKNAFSSGGNFLVAVDGLWQVSDETVRIREGDKEGEMTVSNLDPDEMTIIMTNEDRKIGFSRGRSKLLLGEIGIKTADQDDVEDGVEDAVNASINASTGRPENPLRFWIYREVNEPGSYEVRGRPGEVVDGSTWTWNSTGFGGFFYDLDEGLGDESITLKIADGKLEEETGAVYVARAERKGMEFAGWGDFWTIAFLGEAQFAGYAGGLLSDESESPNLLSEEELVRVLIDDDRRETFDTDSPLGLADGYKLALESVNEGGEKVSLALFKEGVLMDSTVIEPSRSGAHLLDETYLYKRRVGGADDLVVIAVHFRSAFSSGDDGFAEVDAIWQISDEAVSVEEGDECGEMAVQEVDPKEMTIRLANEKEMALRPDDDLPLLGDIRIRTADQFVNNSINASTGLPENPLRFIVYRKVVIKS
jgi:S-layer protein (TIGR01567 family)